MLGRTLGTKWRFLPLIIVMLLALVFAYGAHQSLTATQTIRIASGTPGGGYYELGIKLQQVLNNDLREQRFEAPVVFTHDESRGPQQNLEHLATRTAQLGLVLEGLTVKPKAADTADIRGLVKLSSSRLHIVVGEHVSTKIGKPLTTFTDLLKGVSTKLGRPLRVYVGTPHSGTHAVIELILNYYKVSNERGLGWEFIQHGSSTEAAAALVNGEIDVVCLLVSIETPAVVTMSHHGTLLALEQAAIDAIHTLRPALLVVTIPAGVYNRDFPKVAVPTLGADDILVANGEVSNRLAYRIVRTIATHWPELGSAILLPGDFAEAQLKENDYFPLHPGAVAYYKGDHMPLWPWFEDKVRLAIEHREILLSVGGGIPTLYALLYAWYQRRRVTQLMAHIASLKQQGAIDRAAIENIRMHAITLLAQGKLTRESYATLNEYMEASLKRESPDAAAPVEKESGPSRQ